MLLYVVFRAYLLMGRRSGILIKVDSSTFQLCVWRGPLHIYNQWVAINLMRDFVAAVTVFSFPLAAFSYQELQVNLK